ncbi:MAG: PQQ-binding-like beta-propeller repeat protein [Planctomycetota bacterium]
MAQQHVKTPRGSGRGIWTAALLLALALVALVASAAPVRAQYVPRRKLPKPIDFATSQNDNLFSLQRSQDDIHSLETALDELRDGEHEAAVLRLHELLRTAARGVVPVAPGRYLGVRTAVITTLANLSPAARQVYEELARREAGRRLAQPATELSERSLLALAERFPTSTGGRRARLLLGDRALERGDGLGASQHYRAAIDATPIGSADERRAVDRLYCAQVLAEPQLAQLSQAQTRLPPAAEPVLAVMPPPATGWTAYGGGRSGATPMPEPVGRLQPFWSQDVAAPGFEQSEAGELAMFPVGDLDGVYVNTGRRLTAFDPLRRTIAWRSLSPMDDAGPEPEQPRRRFRRRNPFASINHNMVLSAAIGDDVVVCALQVPDDSVDVTFQQSLSIKNKIPRRRLFAFERQTGRLLWSHFDELQGSLTKRYAGHDSCGPPIVAGDTVYAPVHDRSGAIKFSIGAYDLLTGKPRWRHLVCSSQQDVNMFGNARREFASSPLALDSGVLFGATNLGVAFAIDAADGRARWIRAYEVLKMPPAMLRNQADRPVFFANNAPVVCDGVVCMTPTDGASVLAFDVDSGSTLWQLNHEARLGGIANRVRWLAGAVDGEFVLSGTGVVAVTARPTAADARQDFPASDADDRDADVRSSNRPGARPVFRPVARQLVRPDRISERRSPSMPARPAVTGEHVWVPTRGGMLAFDRNGDPAVRGGKRLDVAGIDGFRAGNLAMLDGIAVSLRNRSIDFLLDPGALLDRSEADVRARPSDPAAILRLATLRRALLTNSSSIADGAAVQELYRRGLEACKQRGLAVDHPVRMALQRELFDQALTIAEVALQADSPDALERIAIARELAPTDERWIAVQTMLLSRCRGDRKIYLRELERLATRASGERMPVPLNVTVPAFVQWQRAIAYADAPPRAIELWQALLERFGDERIDSESMAEIAERKIGELVASHGAEAYAKVEQRAEAAYQAANGDSGALATLTGRFPNSQAASRAALQLLDRAVENGDLHIAVDVLARAVRNSAVTPGVLRRVQVAAFARGNPALARTMHDRLQPFDEPSDWGPDDGMSFAKASAAALARKLPAAAAEAGAGSSTAQIPTRELGIVRPRTRQEYVRLLETRIGSGFARPADAPIYAVAADELVAFALPNGARAGGAKAEADSGSGSESLPAAQEIFSLGVEFLEHALLCGQTLVVPDMLRLFAVDYRTGELKWEVEFDQPRLIESLGITAGVLHCTTQPQIPDGNTMLIGVEPMTGAVLFRRSLGDGELKPKPSDSTLLLLTLAGDGETPSATRIDLLDPVTGETQTTVSCAAALGPDKLQLAADSLATRLYPRGLSADAERVFLPVDSRNSANAAPQVLALNTANGQLAWRWQGESGSRLLLAQRRGTIFCVVEDNPQQGGRVVLLEAATGNSVRTVKIGQDAELLNWESDLAHNPLPEILAIASVADRQSRQGQLFCLATAAEGTTFVVPLGANDGKIARSPRFGENFVSFGARPRDSDGAFRLYGIDLKTRQGVFPDGTSAANRKYRFVRTPGTPHGMHAAGAYTVLSTTRGLILLGSEPPQNR